MKLGPLPAILACGAAALIVGCSSSDDAETGAGPADPTTLGADGSISGSSGSSGSSGASGTVGSSASSGSSGSSGTADGGASGCSGAAADPAAATTVSGYMDKLPANAPSGAARAQIIDVIIRSCEVFGPAASTAPGWDRKYCWAHLVAAIGKESSYNSGLTIKDSYGSRSTGAGPANDPTVGLLQVRFSSTVRDFVRLGRTDSLACIGCTFPAAFATHKGEPDSSAFWAVNGPTQNLATMKDNACNVGLGTWYYYFSASGNGKQSAPTYIDQYCGGQGTAGNLITGMLSHYAGAEAGKGVIANMAGVNALQGTNAGAYQYVTQIKTQFDGMVGAVGGTHPFFLKMQPTPTQYCR